MIDKLDPGDKLFAGVILAIVGLVGLVLVNRSTDYSIIIGDVRGFSFHGGGLSFLSIIIIVLFIIVTLLGIYIIYDTIKKDKRNV